jgi:hypothetical protein
MSDAYRVEVGVVGVKDALKELRKLDPEIRKAFNNEVKRIAAPVVQDAKNAYKFVPLSGMNRAWGGGGGRGRDVFPLTLDRARRGIAVKIDTSRKAVSTIYIRQNDPGWAIFETAGRATVNPLGEALNKKLGEKLEPGKTRLLGRVVFKEKAKVEREITQLCKRVVNVVNGRLKPRREDFGF